MLFGLEAALVKNVSDALRTPVANGLNVTLTAQFSATARLEPQVFAEMAKSAALTPVKEILVTLSVAVPLFVSVAVCPVLVLATVTFPNDRLMGFRVTEGTGAATPVPESDALSGLEEAFVKNVNEADLPPSADGVNVTLTVQLLPAVSVVPHVVVLA